MKRNAKAALIAAGILAVILAAAIMFVLYPERTVLILSPLVAMFLYVCLYNIAKGVMTDRESEMQEDQETEMKKRPSGYRSLQDTDLKRELEEIERNRFTMSEYSFALLMLCERIAEERTFYRKQCEQMLEERRKDNE